MKGEKTGGRKSGTPNKLSTTVRQAVLDAFNKLQEDPEKPYALMQWSKTNTKDFYQIASKLIPTEMALSGQLTEIIIQKKIISKKENT